MIGELRSACAEEDWYRLKELAKKLTHEGFVYVRGLKNPAIEGFVLYHARGGENLEDMLKPFLSALEPGGLAIFVNYDAEYMDGYYPYVGAHIFGDGWLSAVEDVYPYDEGDRIKEAIDKLVNDGEYGSIRFRGEAVQEDLSIYASFLLDAYVGHESFVAITAEGIVATGAAYQE